MSLRERLWFWGPVVAYTAFIFWLSSAPRPIPGIQYLPWIDKVYHMGEYAPLGSLLLRALSQSRRRKPSQGMYVAAFLTALVIGLLDEYYQGFVPRRVSSLWDACADGAGAAIGQIFYGWFPASRRLTKTP